jgi:hypothetical protein
MNTFRVAHVCLDSVCKSQSPSSGVPLTGLGSGWPVVAIWRCVLGYIASSPTILGGSGGFV